VCGDGFPAERSRGVIAGILRPGGLLPPGQPPYAAAMRVLLVEDDVRVGGALETALRRRGYDIVRAGTAAEALAAPPVDLVLLDLGLPDRDGIEVCRELRRRGDVAIIAVTARAQERDRIAGLRTGADDYVVKPFGHRELVARIRAHARRASADRTAAPAHATLEVGMLKLDLRERVLEIEGEEEVRLTGMEFRLLEHLMRSSNSVVPTAELAKQVWGHDDAAARDVVRVTVHRVRRKLGEDGSRRKLIETVPGLGLRLRALTSRREPEHRL